MIKINKIINNLHNQLLIKIYKTSIKRNREALILKKEIIKINMIVTISENSKKDQIATV